MHSWCVSASCFVSSARFFLCHSQISFSGRLDLSIFSFGLLCLALFFVGEGNGVCKFLLKEFIIVLQARFFFASVRELAFGFSKKVVEHIDDAPTLTLVHSGVWCSIVAIAITVLLLGLHQSGQFFSHH